jgi:alpha,alpha-trehalase
VPNGARLYYLNRTQVRVGLFHIRHTLFGPITLTVYSYTLRNTDTFRLQSQPPVLASIVRLVYEALRDEHSVEDTAELKIWDEWPPPTPPKQKKPRPQTKAVTFARYALPLLLKEYAYLTKPERVVRVEVPRTSKAHKITGDFVELARYWAFTDQPRPESWREDVELAEKSGLDDDAEKKKLFRDVASAAESGHDFGSRWLGDSDDAGGTEKGDVVTPGGFNPGPHRALPEPQSDSLASIRTTRIVPCDLNGLMLRCELDIGFLASQVRDEDIKCGTWVKNSEASTSSSLFQVKAGRRRVTINAVLFDETTCRWRDLLLDEDARCPEFAKTAKTYYNMGFTQGVRASDYVPLWCGAFEKDSKQALSVVRSLVKSGLPMPGGIATSLRRTGHQWDFPNAWAPLVHMLVEGCDGFGGDEGQKFARETARRWIKTNAQLLKTSKHMHEKYDARVMGSKPGAGGEYAPQTGFGWTNGVVLFFLNKYVYDGDAASGDFKLRGVRLERLLETIGAQRTTVP